MTRAIYYPKANHVIQWYGSGNSTMPGISKVLFHTTETAGGWPGYGGGGSAPTLTYEPWQHRWRQHFPLNGSARALRDPSGTVVRENRDRIVQVEIACYCDPGLYNRYGHAVTDLDDRAYQDLADFLRFMHDEWGVPLTRRNLEFPPYPQSLSSKYRMTGPQFDAYTGVLGHMHASGNTHGDPGNLDVDRIIRLARGGKQEDELSVADVERIMKELRAIKAQINPDKIFVPKRVREKWGKDADNTHWTPRSVLGKTLVIVSSAQIHAYWANQRATAARDLSAALSKQVAQLATLVNDRTLTDKERAAAVKKISDAAAAAVKEAAVDVTAEDLAEKLTIEARDIPDDQ